MVSPNLRFKEFIDDWNIDEIGNYVKIYDGTHQTPNYQKEGVKFVSVENLSNLFQTDKYISIEDFRSEYKEKAPERNDILLSRIGDIGTPAIVDSDEPLAYYVTLALLKCNKEKLNSKYLYYAIQGKSFQKELYKRTLHVAFPKKINLGEIGLCKFAFPSLEEQQKIASFFSLFDKNIRKLQEGIEHLELFQKGMIQQIFSQAIRFKDENGHEFSDWTSSTLDDLGTFIRSYSFSRDVEGEGEYYHIHYGDIHSKFSGVITLRTDLPSINIDTEATYTLLENGDVIFADASEDTSDLGKTVVLLEAGNRKIIGGLHTLCFRPSNRLDPLFLHFYTKTDEYKKFIRINANGVSVFGLSKQVLASLQVPLPDIREQKKISDFLYKLTMKIELLKIKKKELETMKMGFMNQMLI